MVDKRNQLSRELITGAAVDLVAREGLAGLSMRRLAQELDVWPMSVYRHFRDKEDLLDAVAAAASEGVNVPPARGSWEDQLSALADELRVVLARQPTDLRRRAFISPALVQLTDGAVRVLRDGGFDAANAALAWRAVVAYVVGSIEVEAVTGSERETQAALLAAAGDDEPEVARAAPELARALAGGEAAFDAGLERLIGGFVGSAARGG